MEITFFVICSIRRHHEHDGRFIIRNIVLDPYHHSCLRIQDVHRNL